MERISRPSLNKECSCTCIVNIPSKRNNYDAYTFFLLLNYNLLNITIEKYWKMTFIIEDKKGVCI